MHILHGNCSATMANSDTLPFCELERKALPHCYGQGQKGKCQCIQSYKRAFIMQPVQFKERELVFLSFAACVFAEPRSPLHPSDRV